MLNCGANATLDFYNCLCVCGGGYQLVNGKCQAKCVKTCPSQNYQLDKVIKKNIFVLFSILNIFQGEVHLRLRSGL